MDRLVRYLATLHWFNEDSFHTIANNTRLNYSRYGRNFIIIIMIRPILLLI